LIPILLAGCSDVEQMTIYTGTARTRVDIDPAGVQRIEALATDEGTIRVEDWSGNTIRIIGDVRAKGTYDAQADSRAQAVRIHVEKNGDLLAIRPDLPMMGERRHYKVNLKILLPVREDPVPLCLVEETKLALVLQNGNWTVSGK